MSQEDRSCVRDADFDGLFDDLGYKTPSFRRFAN